MKVIAATILLSTAGALPAAASSFALLKRAATQPSPSIIMFVEPSAGREPVLLGGAAMAYPAPAPSIEGRDTGYRRVSASVIAIGEPAVEKTHVAAIPAEPKPMRNPHLPPMVFRGGLIGDAFVQGSGMPASVAAAAQGLDPGASAAAGKDNAPNQKAPAGPAKAPPPPPPAAPPPQFLRPE